MEHLFLANMDKDWVMIFAVQVPFSLPTGVDQSHHQLPMAAHNQNYSQ
jgi:hypothetical protein